MTPGPWVQVVPGRFLRDIEVCACAGTQPLPHKKGLGFNGEPQFSFYTRCLVLLPLRLVIPTLRLVTLTKRLVALQLRQARWPRDVNGHRAGVRGRGFGLGAGALFLGPCVP